MLSTCCTGGVYLLCVRRHRTSGLFAAWEFNVVGFSTVFVVIFQLQNLERERTVKQERTMQQEIEQLNQQIIDKSESLEVIILNYGFYAFWI